MAFQNSQLVSSQICDQLMTSFASAVRISAEKVEAKLIQFLNDAFLFWDENSDLSPEMISSEGGRQLVLELFKTSCKRRHASKVDLTSLWIQGLKTIVAKESERKKEILSKMFSHIRRILESNGDDDEQIFQSFSLLNLLRSDEDKDFWQNCWLEMLPKTKSDGSGICDSIENSLLFSITNQVQLTILNLRNPAKQNSSANKNKKRAAEFFLKTAKLLLEENGGKVEMVPALLDVLALAVTFQCSEVEPEEETRMTLQKIVQESLTLESKKSLKEIAFKNSKSFGWEWSLALHRILTWVKDDPEVKNLIKVTDLVPESAFWSEPELHTLQVNNNNYNNSFYSFCIRHHIDTLKRKINFSLLNLPI